MTPAPAHQEPLTREYDWTMDSPCFAVIDAIARYEDVETPQMAQDLPALQYTLNTDALESLTTDSTLTTLSFQYAGYHVHIVEETVTITNPAPSQ